MDVIFEDVQLVVCVKPQGIRSAADASGKPSMADLLAPRSVWPVHRLDREAGGLMVLQNGAVCRCTLCRHAGRGI